MSEEKKSKSMRKTLFGVILTTFVLSLVSMVLSVAIATKVGVFPGLDNENKPISKKYDKGQSVEKAQKTGKPMLIWFYTDWCGYCKMFGPVFADINKDRSVKKDFAIAYVNCDEQKNKEYIEEYGVKGFPTVIMVDGERRVQIGSDTLFAPDAFEAIKKQLSDFLKK